MYGLHDIFFLIRQMAVDSDRGIEVISHQVSDPLQADIRHLVTEVGAIVVPENMCREAVDHFCITSASGGQVHLPGDARPHLYIG